MMVHSIILKSYEEETLQLQQEVWDGEIIALPYQEKIKNYILDVLKIFRKIY